MYDSAFFFVGRFARCRRAVELLLYLLQQRVSPLPGHYIQSVQIGLESTRGSILSRFFFTDKLTVRGRYDRFPVLKTERNQLQGFSISKSLILFISVFLLPLIAVGYGDHQILMSTLEGGLFLTTFTWPYGNAARHCRVVREKFGRRSKLSRIDFKLFCFVLFSTRSTPEIKKRVSWFPRHALMYLIALMPRTKNTKKKS